PLTFSPSPYTTLFRSHRLSDVPGKPSGGGAGYGGPSLLGHPFGYPGVPLPHLHVGGPAGRGGAGRHRRDFRGGLRQGNVRGGKQDRKSTRLNSSHVSI